MENHISNNLPVDRLYGDRRHFSIIGLTGKAGSGCSTLAQYMSSKEFLKRVRKPEDIHIDFDNKFEDNEFSFQYDKQGTSNLAIGGLVFKQKYSICYNFAQQFYKEYRIIKYTHVLWLFVLLEAKNELKICDAGNLVKKIAFVLMEYYKPSKLPNNDRDFIEVMHYDDGKRKEFEQSLLRNYTKWDELCDELNKLPRSFVDDLDDSKKGIEQLEIFIRADGVFEGFVAYLLKSLAEEDYYSLCFLHHRLACKIRNGNTFLSREIEKKDKLNQNLYDIAKLINILIKGIKHRSDKDDCRIVIDSLRNSIEALYFKERYTAFYLICVNDGHSRETRLRKNIIQKMPKTSGDSELLDIVFNKVKRLTEIELSGKEFSKGKFASPDVENVIANAEIHISNNNDAGQLMETPVFEFCSMAEQWMKYSSLILHPGLITPSAEERCMVVAYTAKFNSSCLSRQVGAVITNQYHSIRTIGWNDVPYGQMPCGLRELHNLNGTCSECHYIYSEFESGPHATYGEQCFSDKVADSFSNIKNKVGLDKKEGIVEKPNELMGLPFSYCFKTLHNTFEGEKNQVYTRSLHAEENAILQMAKYGGGPLMNGIIYVTASPCELCAKKLYQIGVRKIVYIDPYPGISLNQIIRAGFKRPHLKLFEGAYGSSYFKLYQPFMPYKDEIGIRLGQDLGVHSKNELLDAILEKVELSAQPSYTKEEITKIVDAIFNKKV